MTRATRITCMVLATLVPPTDALGTQGDRIGPNASPCAQKSAGKKGGTPLCEGFNFYTEFDEQFAGYTEVAPELLHVERDAPTYLITSQSMFHHPPFIETHPSQFSLHAPLDTTEATTPPSKNPGS